MNSLNSISHFLDNTNSLYLGFLSSAYIFGDALWLIPAGLILDKVNPLKVVLVSFLGYLAALFLFSYSNNHDLLVFSRFLMGCFHAFSLLACLKLISYNIKPQHKTLLISLAVTIALLGGLIAQIPLFYLIENFGLSTALTINLIFGAIIFSIIFVFYKFSLSNSQLNIDSNVESVKIIHNIYYTLKKKNIWYAAAYVATLSLPLMILGSVWGIEYLVAINHISATHASYVSSMIFMGIILGGPLVGLISCKIAVETLLRFGAIGTFLVLLLVILSAKFPVALLGPLFFLLGLISSCQILGYTVMSQASNQALAGISIGVANALVMFFTALCQMIFGLLVHAQFAASMFYVRDYFSGFLFIGCLFMFIIWFTLKYTKATANSF
jgi:MFS family permease